MIYAVLGFILVYIWAGQFDATNMTFIELAIIWFILLILFVAIKFCLIAKDEDKDKTDKKN